MVRLTAHEKAELSRLMADELQHPPTIGVVGMSGVGKSSTINRLFRTSLDISHTVACTKEFWEIKTKIESSSGPAAGQPVELRIFDAPGLGEDFRRDPYYLERYAELLPQCDVILWILASRNRAIALDQTYLDKFTQLSDKMVFGLSQVDLVDPLDWNPSLPIPSKEQDRNIAEIITDRAERLQAVLGRKVTITPYSNVKGYNLEALFSELLQACTSKRKWIFQGIKGFSFEDFMPDSIRQLTSHSETVETDRPVPPSVDSDAFTPSRPAVRRPSPTRLKWLAAILTELGFGRASDEDKALLREVVGRDDIEENPPTDEELDRISSHVRRNKTRGGDRVR